MDGFEFDSSVPFGSGFFVPHGHDESHASPFFFPLPKRCPYFNPQPSHVPLQPTKNVMVSEQDPVSDVIIRTIRQILDMDLLSNDKKVEMIDDILNVH